jgi:hypothetical protein
MRSLERALYWALAGTLMGLGFVGFGFGLLPLLLGLVMAIYGVWRLGSGGLWMVLATAGAVPAIILLSSYLTLDPTHVTLGPHHLTTVAIFGLLALAGCLWGLFSHRET